MGAAKQAWGWYPAGQIWVPMQVAATGKLVIDPTAIFEEPPTNGEMEKAATSNWSFDHNANVNAHHNRQHALDSAADHTNRITLSQMATGAANLVLTGQGAGSDPVYAAAPSLWALAETLSPAAVNTITSSVFAVHDLWMLIMYLTCTEVAETIINLRLNNDAGNTYDWRVINDNTIVQTGTVSAIQLGSTVKTVPACGIVYVTGKRGGTGNRISTYGGCGRSYEYNRGVDGQYGAAADVTRFTIFGPTMTGKIKIYYMDY